MNLTEINFHRVIVKSGAVLEIYHQKSYMTLGMSNIVEFEKLSRRNTNIPIVMNLALTSQTNRLRIYCQIGLTMSNLAI